MEPNHILVPYDNEKKNTNDQYGFVQYTLSAVTSCPIFGKLGSAHECFESTTGKRKVIVVDRICRKVHS